MRSAFLFISNWKTFVFVLIACFILTISCSKNEKSIEYPLIEFISDSTCLYSDTSLPMGTLMRFKIKASSKFSPITNFVITYNNGTEQYFLDTGIYNNEFYYTLEIIKGTTPAEEWQFSVMNKDRLSASVRIVIELDSGGVFGNIKSHAVTLGAQNNTQYGHFYSFSNETVYTLEQAYNNQQKADIAYCYYTDYKSTLSSPNDNDAPSVFTGQFGISNWQTRNESRYNLTTLSPADFDNAQKDSLLIASYDVIGAKRKGKDIQEGQVWAFRIQSGKIGLIKVDNIVSNATGKVDLKIKIQE